MDVVLSRDKQAKFPARCVYCGLPEHHHQARASAGAGQGIFFFLSWFESGRKQVEFPACVPCSWRAQMRGWIVLAMSAASAAAAGWILFGMLGLGGGRAGFKLAVFGTFIAGILPALIDGFLPALFRVSFSDEDDTITYRFADAALGHEFELLNLPPLSAPALDPADIADIKFGEAPPEPLKLPADFALQGTATDSFIPPPVELEDRSNPYRNLRDDRFGK